MYVWWRILEISPSGVDFDRKEDAIISFIAEIFRPQPSFDGERK